MSQHDVYVRIHHMLDHASEALALTKGHTRADLDTDRLLNLALVRLLEVVGEAAAQVPDDFRAANPEIPWREITGLRNRLIHDYDEVDFDILWTIIEDDLPPLVQQLSVLVEAHDQP